jgi:hypothetical protein
MKMTATDTNFEGARLRGWLVGAGSAVSNPTSHIATGATTPSLTLSSLLPPVLGAETYTADLAYHSDRVAQAAGAAYVDLSTGLDSSGNIQHKGGSLNANWTVTGASNPIDQPNAYVVDRSDPDWGTWIGNGAYSSWIAANPFDRTGNEGNLTFTRTFDVATPSTATIIGGAWTSDNPGTLSLNGHLLSTLPNSGSTLLHLHAFSTTASDFVAGLNTLTMQVTGDAWDGGRLRGWLVGAGSNASGPTFHI